MQLNYAYSASRGYLADPYKILSIIDGITGATLDYVYENRPEARTKHVLYWRAKHHFEGENVGDLTYRYMTDDWGIQSHTVDVKYRYYYARKRYMEPLLRFYTQTEADFYRYGLISGEAMPVNASADYRLAAFNAVTFGVKVGFPGFHNRETMVKFEFYQQYGNDHPSDAVGILRDYDLFPGVTALALAFTYAF